METRVALVGIMMNNRDSAAKLNEIVQEYSDYIVGRMGIPYAKKNVSVISIMIDAPQNIISAFAGKIGMLPNVSSSTIYAKEK